MNNSGPSDPIKLLRKVRALNETFVKQMARLQRRVVELEGEIQHDETGAGRVRVLVVDDEPSVWQVLEYLSDDHGYELTCVADGEAAMRAFEATPFPIVITDKNLPGMSGLDVLRQVKVQRPETKVVMITGYSSEAAAIEALNLGASAYLTKPFEDIDEVAALVKKLADAHTAKAKKDHFRHEFRERNHAFLVDYARIRDEMDQCLAAHDETDDGTET